MTVIGAAKELTESGDGCVIQSPSLFKLKPNKEIIPVYFPNDEIMRGRNYQQ